MSRTKCAPLALVVTVFVSTLQGRSEEATAFTFLGYVRAEQIRACTVVPSKCHEDFDKLALFAEQLDAREKMAEVLEQSGDKEKALEARRQITSSAVMLDSLLDLLILYWKNKE